MAQKLGYRTTKTFTNSPKKHKYESFAIELYKRFKGIND